MSLLPYFFSLSDACEEVVIRDGELLSARLCHLALLHVVKCSNRDFLVLFSLLAVSQVYAAEFHLNLVNRISCKMWLV